MGCLCSSFYHSISTLVVFQLYQPRNHFVNADAGTAATLVVFELLYGFVLTKGAFCVRLREPFAQVFQVVQFMGHRGYEHSAYIGVFSQALVGLQF